MNAVLLVDKPAGPTSFGALTQVRRALGRGAKVGHAGTLDPFATGLLVLLVGRATRLAPYLVGLDKRYRATIRLGARSDSGDRDGTIEPGDGPLPTPSELAAASAALVGEIEQIPPTTSAIRIGGRRAYELARAGQEVAMPARRVTVHSLVVQSYDEDAGSAVMDVHCTKGTYIRALARDIGEAVGCGAYCQELRRLRIGHLDIVDAGLPEAVAAEPLALPWHRTPAQALAHLPTREIDGAERAELSHGRSIALESEQGPTLCMAAGVLVCLAEPRDGLLRPRVVLEPAA